MQSVSFYTDGSLHIISIISCISCINRINNANICVKRDKSRT